MSLLHVFGVVLGATGFWKLIEMLLQYKVQKRLRNAEINNLNTQANSLVVENYKLWTDKMERRLKEVESKNDSMNLTIIKQRDRINILEINNTVMNQTIIKQRDRITELETEVQAYKKQKQ